MIFTLLKDLDHPALLEEQKQNIYADAYEKNLNQYVKLPSKKKEMDIHDSLDYWPKIIKDGINWLSFLDIMEYTADMIENDIIILP